MSDSDGASSVNVSDLIRENFDRKAMYNSLMVEAEKLREALDMYNVYNMEPDNGEVADNAITNFDKYLKDQDENT